MAVVERNPMQALINCRNFDEVDGLLDELKVAATLQGDAFYEQRTIFLNGIMHIEDSFGAKNMTPENLYNLTKEGLVSQKWHK